jgi:hypothetical protein
MSKGVVDMTSGTAGVTLPKVTGFRVSGFQPIFSDPIAGVLKPGPLVILGGNGLGKTTLMQAVIYALTGGATWEIEEDKQYRWDHTYFKKRLESPNLAAIEVDFELGGERITVRRGCMSSTLRAIRVGEEWTDDPSTAATVYAESLLRLGGFASPFDFSFVVHRLLYLPESRRLLAWDLDAQVRLLMLLGNDAGVEERFRTRRAELKNLDSRKRHVHVALEKAKGQLSRLMEFDESGSPDPAEDEPPVGATEPPESFGLRLEQLVGSLNQSRQSRRELESQELTLSRRLSQLSSEIEQLRADVEQEESAFIASSLKQRESSDNLAITKLLELAICPACGTRSLDLQARAQAFAATHHCTLCGSDEPTADPPRLATLRSQLAEKLRAQKETEVQLRPIRQRAEAFRLSEMDQVASVNQLRFSQPVVAVKTQDLPQPTKTALQDMEEALRAEEADLAAQQLALRDKLEREYQEFRESSSERSEKLRKLYTKYASAFLGLTCDLVEVDDGDRLLSLSRFVPNFNNRLRDAPDTCSEAQRFFLDIAFRMAVIDLASTLTDSVSTFVCETPENALDMSYVDNVVEMFTSFAKKKHTLLLTANIQPDGFASKLLKAHVPKRERTRRVINLLELGQLSDVHQDALDDMQAAVTDMLEA